MCCLLPRHLAVPLQAASQSMAAEAVRAARGKDSLQFMEHYVLGSHPGVATQATAELAAAAGHTLGLGVHGSSDGKAPRRPLPLHAHIHAHTHTLFDLMLLGLFKGSQVLVLALIGDVHVPAACMRTRHVLALIGACTAPACMRARLHAKP